MKRNQKEGKLEPEGEQMNHWSNTFLDGNGVNSGHRGDTGHEATILQDLREGRIWVQINLWVGGRVLILHLGENIYSECSIPHCMVSQHSYCHQESSFTCLRVVAYKHPLTLPLPFPCPQIDWATLSVCIALYSFGKKCYYLVKKLVKFRYVFAFSMYSFMNFLNAYNLFCSTGFYKVENFNFMH